MVVKESLIDHARPSALLDDGEGEQGHKQPHIVSEGPDSDSAPVTVGMRQLQSFFDGPQRLQQHQRRQ